MFRSDNIKRVLVVDSHLSDTNRLAWELPHDRYALTFAGGLSEAMAMVKESEYDIALIEVDLPKLNSFSLLRKIRDERPRTKVIMMTDYGDDDLWVDVMNEGASDLIARPLMRRDLERSLQ